MKRLRHSPKMHLKRGNLVGSARRDDGIIGSFNPKGVVSQSPRLPYSATLGTRERTTLFLRCLSQTQRGCGHGRYRIQIFNLQTEAATPPGLKHTSKRADRSCSPVPKVAEYSNLGLWDTTTSWLAAYSAWLAASNDNPYCRQVALTLSRLTPVVFSWHRANEWRVLSHLLLFP